VSFPRPCRLSIGTITAEPRRGKPRDGSHVGLDSSKITQARITYGGRGQITAVQQPRYGQQVMDVLLPF
jgi:hypothetical protein